MKLAILSAISLTLLLTASVVRAQQFNGSLKETFGGQPFVTIAAQLESPGIPGIVSIEAEVRSKAILTRRSASLTCAHPAHATLSYYVQRISKDKYYVADAEGRHTILTRHSRTKRFVSRRLHLHHSEQRLTMSNFGRTKVKVQLAVEEELAPGIMCKYLLRGYVRQ